MLDHLTLAAASLCVIMFVSLLESCSGCNDGRKDVDYERIGQVRSPWIPLTIPIYNWAYDVCRENARME